MIWLELKRRKKGRLSDEQEDIASHLQNNGHIYLVTDNVDKAVAFLKLHGVLRSNIEMQ